MVKITTNQTCETRREQIREGIDSVIERHNNVFQPETPLPWDEIFPSARAPLTRNRLGIWMHPVSMYPPFVPYPLPPPIRYDDELNALIAEAERAIAMLDQTARVRLGDIDQAIRECSINEAPHEPGNPCFSHLAGCVSCYTGTENALRWGFEQICGGSPITAGMVREIHARILALHPAPAEPGLFRWDRPLPSEVMVEMVARLPHSPIFSHNPQKFAEPLFAELLAFMRADDDIPEPIRAALVWLNFLIVRPHCAGNARVARVVVALYLVSRGLLPAPVMGIGSLFRDHFEEHSTRMIAVRRDDGALEEYIKFFIRGLIVGARESLDGFARRARS